jgi:hypothetical protein
MDEFGGEKGELGREVDVMAKQRLEERTGYLNLVELIIKKSKNSREYKKYNEIVSMLILNYYKRLGNIEQATEMVYSLVESADSVHDLMSHHQALVKEEKGSGTSDVDHARAKITNTLLNDYKKRFGNRKVEEYNVLVLQTWVNKVENVSELAILMDNMLTIRDKIGNSWDYEVHVVPLLLEKSFNTETLIDFTTSTTNFVVGLTRRLKDSYLAVMTAVKILEVSDTPKVMKKYIRDMIKDISKKIDSLNTEAAIINSNTISRITKVVRVKEIHSQVAELNKQIEELMNGIDPKELMLEGSRR